MPGNTRDSSGPLLLSRPAARTRLGLSRRNFDTLVDEGAITVEKIGPKYYVPIGVVEALEARWTAPPPEVDA